VKDIVEIIRKRFKGTFHYKSLAKILGAKGEERKVLLDKLNLLSEKGVLMKTAKGRFILPDEKRYIKATVTCHRDGFGFAIPFDTSLEDIFLPPHTLKDVYDGDTVLVSIKKSRGKKKEGEVVKILERSLKKIVGTIYRVKDRFYLKPYDTKIFWHLLLKENKTNVSLKAGDTVIADIIQYPVNKVGVGSVSSILKGDDYTFEVFNLIAKSGIDTVYPSLSSKEALKVIKDKQQKQEKDRRDLTDMGFVTIDGEKAKDFDDAVCVIKEKSGFKLYVAIADVSFFVMKGKQLDKEAFFRGNSYYFPDRVLPMLPESLSNEECSLKPNEERRSFVVEISYNKKGEKVKQEFYPAKIKSKARLTYEKVEEFLCEGKGMPSELGKMLLNMRELTELLFAQRYQNGTIDFDFPEPDIIIGMSGKIENIARLNRLSSHRIIEEFMIAANIAVAEWFEKMKLPTIYRVHEPPDPEKIKNLKVLLKRLGVELKEKPEPKDIQQIIKSFKNSPYEKLVSTLTLRSMKQARYSSQNVGHFGLALKNYLHFTSPIRRYADLVVHRNLRDFLLLRNEPPNVEVFERELESIAVHLNKRERLAFDMEKEVFSFACAKLMKDMVGEEFKGVVSSVTPQGFYVELLDYFVEGFVPLENLKDDYYQYDEQYLSLTGRRVKKRFAIGKEVVVKVVNVDLPAKRIEFGLV